jgi:DNA-binding CsgD family transcriptional regulator
MTGRTVSHVELLELLDGLSVCVGVMDADGTVLYANRAALDNMDKSAVEAGALCPVAAVAIEVARDQTERNNVVVEVPPGRPWRGRLWPLDRSHVAVWFQREMVHNPDLTKLTSRFNLQVQEARLALLIADGKTGREIARLLRVPVGTIQARTWRLYRKLGVRNRAGLTALVVTTGLEE